MVSGESLNEEKKLDKQYGLAEYSSAIKGALYDAEAPHNI